ncbi:MAG: ABC transporter ATP-binding protein [Bacilli bacterium]
MKSLLKIYSRCYTKKYLIYAIFAIIFMIGDVGIALAIPAITKGIFTEINSGRNDLTYVYQTGILVVVVALGAVITTILNNVFAQHLSTKIAKDLRKDLFTKVQDLSFSNVDKITSGTLMTVIANDTNQIQQIIMTSFRAILRSPLTLIGALVMAFVTNKDLLFIVLIAVFILGFAITKIITRAAKIFASLQEKTDDLNEKLIESISGAREIKVFQTEQADFDKFSKVNNEYTDTIVKANKQMALMDPIIVLVSNLAIGAVLLAASYFVSRYTGEARIAMVGTISAYISYLQQIIMSLMMLSMVAVSLSRAAVSADRIDLVLNTKIDIVNNDLAIKDINIQGDIEFHNVSFGYADEENGGSAKTIENINLKIKAGSTIGVIGSTGSGKTTLVQLIPRLYDTTEGKLLIDGRNVRDYDLNFLREQISYVTQEPLIFSGTISSNIKQGKEESTETEMVKASKLACAYEYIESTENQFEHGITQGGTNLSGGQKQRLSLTRALIRNPKILILDDSMSAVDAKIEAQIKNNLGTLSKQTTIIVAQKITSIRNCDNIIVLDNTGHLDGYGKHDQLLVKSKVYQEIYASQFGGQNE